MQLPTIHYNIFPKNKFTTSWFKKIKLFTQNYLHLKTHHPKLSLCKPIFNHNIFGEWKTPHIIFKESRSEASVSEDSTLHWHPHIFCSIFNPQPPNYSQNFVYMNSPPPPPPSSTTSPSPPTPPPPGDACIF